MKYGFVYIWRDKKHKRYYIGCHWGTEDDGYICSSPWMKNSFNRRPNDFKRRILSRVYTNKKDMFEIESLWQSLIKDCELGSRYYNIKRHGDRHWSINEEKSKSVGEKISKSPNRAKNISIAMKGKQPSPLNIAMRNEGYRKRVISNEERIKRSNSAKGRIFSDETIRKLSKPKALIACPHCNKIGGTPTMRRWHFEKCKYK